MGSQVRALLFPPKDLALWCSRLARQPVTLEVDGSSPFGVAIKSQICAMRKISSSYASVAQLVEQRTENPRVVGSIPTGGTKFAGVAHPVERHLAKVEVASSSLVTRSIRYRGQVVRQESAKLSLASSNLAGTSKTKRTSIWMSFLFWKNRAVRFEDQKCDCPGISHLPTARRRQHICFCPFPGKNANKSGW